MAKKKYQYKPAGAGAYVNANKVGMSHSDTAAMRDAGNAWIAANAAGDEEGKRKAHEAAEEIRKRYHYSGGGDGSEYIPLPKEEPESRPSSRPSRPRPETPKAPDLKPELDRLTQQMEQQQKLEADRAVQQGVDALQRAEEDAQQQFETQRSQNDRDERKALDNHALYMEARGDRGGIGHAQYGEIQAQAMANRRAIGASQTKLATDTARQIAELRAQGEFKKADDILKLSQSYLKELMDLKRWGADYDMDAFKLQQELERWQQELELKQGQILGQYQGKDTLQAQKEQQRAEEERQKAEEQQRRLRAQQGMEALKLGIRPSPSQQQAMGYTDEQITAMLETYRKKEEEQEKQPDRKPSPHTPSKKPGPAKPEKPEYQAPAYLEGLDIYQQLYATGSRNQADAYYYLTHTMGMDNTRARALAGYFQEKMDYGEVEAWWDHFPATGRGFTTNPNGGTGDDSWVVVPGIGRVKLKYLLRGVESGYVIASRDPKTGAWTYERNWDKK